MRRSIFLVCVLATVVAVVGFSPLAFAQSDEVKSYLSLYFTPEELEVQSATRSSQPVSSVAENITVVTAADIERMNAHTLADVLNTVPGVEMWLLGGPGQQAEVTMLGSNSNHVTVIMDGVTLNYLFSGFAEPGMIPVQNIEKIEIIKGPASSAWGSALGGIVNIITKSGRSVDQGSVLSGSYGSNGFGDFRAETRGKQDRVGYYLSAGRLQSDGLSPNTSTSENNAYAKFTYDLTDKTDVQLAFAYARTWRDDLLMDNYFGGDRSEHLHSTLAVNSALTNNLDLNISVWTSNQYMNSSYAADITTDNLSYIKELNQGYGSSAKLTWKGAQQTFVLGADTSDMVDKNDELPEGRQTIRKWAVYANDTLLLNRFSVIPGIRFDHTSSEGDITSPSLGITYGFENSTILRAFAAHGFNIPTTGARFGFLGGWVANPDLKMETVWSYQAGMETAALKYVWIKFMAFRNDIRNAIDQTVLSDGNSQMQNIGRERREGIVIEAKTAPVFNIAFSAGAEIVSAKDLTTGEHVPDVPVQIYDIGIKYDDKNSFNALLQGRHLNWNATEDEMSKYHSILLDLNVIKKIYQRKDAALEVFVNAHNLLNTAQYLTLYYPNPERWYEGGVRYKF